jgi:hypothetical protein
MNGMWYNIIEMIVAAICYAAALLLELLRFLRGERWQLWHWQLRYWQHWGALGFAVIGFLFHTFFIYQQHIVAEQPIGGVGMFFLASAWGLVLVYLLWTCRYPNIPFGMILLPLALLLLVGGHWSVSTVQTTGLTLESIVKMLHVASAAGFVISLSIGCVCGILYFLESYLLKRRRSLSPKIKLPSLEWSKSAATISFAAASLFLMSLFSMATVMGIDTLQKTNYFIIVGMCCLILLIWMCIPAWVSRLDRVNGKRYCIISIIIFLVLILFILMKCYVSLV